MTEQGWLECDAPWAMLEFWRGRTSDRKLRLFAVAGCRRAGDLFKADQSLPILLAFLERLADGEVSAELAPSIPFGKPNPHLMLRGTLVRTESWLCAWNTT